jgi:hypothetical protein
MTTRTIIAISTLMLAAAVLAVGLTTPSEAGTFIKRPPLPNNIVIAVTNHRTYHPPRGCLGDPTCHLPGSYKGGEGWPDTGLNCTYTTHGGCSPQ